MMEFDTHYVHQVAKYGFFGLTWIKFPMKCTIRKITLFFVEQLLIKNVVLVHDELYTHQVYCWLSNLSASLKTCIWKHEYIKRAFKQQRKIPKKVDQGCFVLFNLLFLWFPFFDIPYMTIKDILMEHQFFNWLKIYRTYLVRYT